MVTPEVCEETQVPHRDLREDFDDRWRWINTTLETADAIGEQFQDRQGVILV